MSYKFRACYVPRDGENEGQFHPDVFLRLIRLTSTGADIEDAMKYDVWQGHRNSTNGNFKFWVDDAELDNYIEIMNRQDIAQKLGRKLSYDEAKKFYLIKEDFAKEYFISRLSKDMKPEDVINLLSHLQGAKNEAQLKFVEFMLDKERNVKLSNDNYYEESYYDLIQLLTKEEDINTFIEIYSQLPLPVSQAGLISEAMKNGNLTFKYNLLKDLSFFKSDRIFKGFIDMCKKAKTPAQAEFIKHLDKFLQENPEFADKISTLDEIPLFTIDEASNDATRFIQILDSVAEFSELFKHIIRFEYDFKNLFSEKNDRARYRLVEEILKNDDSPIDDIWKGEYAKNILISEMSTEKIQNFIANKGYDLESLSEICNLYTGANIFYLDKYFDILVNEQRFTAKDVAKLMHGGVSDDFGNRKLLFDGRLEIYNKYKSDSRISDADFVQILSYTNSNNKAFISYLLDDNQISISNVLKILREIDRRHISLKKFGQASFEKLKQQVLNSLRKDIPVIEEELLPSFESSQNIDFQAIYKIDLENFAGRGYDISEDFTEYISDLEQHGIETYSYKSGDELIGYLQLEPVKDDELYIYSIGVDKKYQNTRLSYEVLMGIRATIIKEAQKKNVKKVVLDVEQDNPMLIKLYTEKFGFKITGENEYGDLHMELEVEDYYPAYETPMEKVSDAVIYSQTDVTKDMFDKALKDAKAKKNQIKAFNQDLTDKDLEEFFNQYKEDIIYTIDLIGLSAFEYSFTSKKKGMEALMEAVNILRNSSTVEEYNSMKSKLSDKSIEPQDRLKKLRILAGLKPHCNTKEFAKFIELVKPNTPTQKEIKDAQDIWNDTKFWNRFKELSFEEKFEQKLAEFAIRFGVNKNDPKLRTFFEKRISTDSQGNKIFKGVKGSDITKLLETIVKARNNAVFNKAIYQKMFNLAHVPYSKELANKLNIIESPHLGSIFMGSEDFIKTFSTMLQRLSLHPELSVEETFNQLSQNIETKRQFEEHNIPYERFTRPDKNSFKIVRVEVNAAKAKSDALARLVAEFNDVAFKALPKEETDKILKDLEEKLGIKAVIRKVPNYVGDGFRNGEREELDFVNKEGKPLTFEDLPKMISTIIATINQNKFWSTKQADATIEQHKETIYSHLTKDRKTDIENAAKIKSDKVSELVIRQTDMNKLGTALFLGNKLCCTGIGDGCNQFSAPTYCMNKCIGAIEIADGDYIAGNTMCYFAEIDGKMAFVLDNIEVQPGYKEDNVRDAFMDYVKQLCSEMGLPDIPIYAGPHRHKFEMKVYPTETHNVTIIGSTGDDRVYIDYAGSQYLDGNSSIKNIEMFKIR